MSPPPALSPRAARAGLSRLAPGPGGRPASVLSRRGLLSAGVLAGVLAATGVAVAARPRGGTLRLAVAAPSGHALGALESLTEIGPAGELWPGLALAWETDAGARTWRLALDPAARFHDGAPVTPADAAASLLRGGVSGVVALDAEGSLGLRLALAAPDPDLPLRLAAPGLAVRRGGGGVGTGLYRPDEGGLIATRVAGHPREGRAGFVDAVALVVEPDPGRRLALLRAGGVDAAEGPFEALPQTLAVAAPATGEPWDTLRALWGGAAPAPVWHRAGLGHDAVSGAAPLDGGRLAERWWLSA